MSSYYIIRNSQQYGPYTLDNLKTYVENGQLLKCDTACEEKNLSNQKTVDFFLKLNGVKAKVPHAGGLFVQLKAIGSELIFPKDARQGKKWKQDQRLLFLGLIGLIPLALGSLIHGGFLMFYSISLFFATVWGLFFYYLFKTPQVTLKTTILVFFLTQAFVFAIFGFGLNYIINPFYFIGQDSVFPLSILFFVCAVGITEEFVKSIPLYIITKRSKAPVIPQTLVFYGLVSGIAFGVFEGVQYQMSVNSEMGYDQSFFLNIARLTSLPFLHAIWCGIAGYFISFSKLYPKYRISLCCLALCVPALLHGLYDSFCDIPFGIVISLLLGFLAVALLMTYLKQGVNYQSKLSK